MHNVELPNVHEVLHKVRNGIEVKDVGFVKVELVAVKLQFLDGPEFLKVLWKIIY